VPNDEGGRPFERLLGLPVGVVVALLWVVGVLVIGTGVLVVYLGGLVLVRTLAGA
jgi:hypothetical protein